MGHAPGLDWLWGQNLGFTPLLGVGLSPPMPHCTYQSPMLWEERRERQHEKPLQLLPLEQLPAFPYSITPRGGFSADNIVSFSSSEFITVLHITLPSHSVEMTYRFENNYPIPLGAILTG